MRGGGRDAFGFRTAVLAVLVFGGAVMLGCGAEALPFPPPATGGVCFQDSDCVPNGCCGEATSSVPASEAPDCSQVACDGSCPANQLECGCAIPVCSDSQCSIAVTSGPGCPGSSPLPLR